MSTPNIAPSGDARSVDAGRGLAWWQEAWTLFMKAPALWIVVTLVALVAAILLTMLPLVGQFLVSLAAPGVIGSLLLGARRVDTGGALQFDDLWAGFRVQMTPLLTLGALLVAATLALTAIAVMLGIGSLAGMIGGAGMHSGAAVAGALGLGLIAMLVVLLASFAIAMAFFFAPALVVFRNTAPLEAVKLSLGAVLRNIVPFVVWGVIYIVAAALASIPFMLGWILLLPLALLSTYAAYRDVFGH